MIEIGFLISAFVAGLLTFLAPCTLPLVPGYLGFISGVDKSELENPETASRARRRVFLNGLFFVIGFSVIFIIFGTLAGIAGQALVPYRIWLTRLGGAFVILFGLFMMGVLKLKFLQSERRIKMPSWLKPGRPSSSLVVGGAFAFGWTPCVGPILGSILVLASSTATVFQGAVLLSVFSLGLAVPFLLVALAFSSATKYISKIAKYLQVVSFIGGLFLVLLGVLLVSNNFGLLLQYGYSLLDFINYEGLLNYL